MCFSLSVLFNLSDCRGLELASLRVFYFKDYIEYKGWITFHQVINTLIESRFRIQVFLQALAWKSAKKLSVKSGVILPLSHCSLFYGQVFASILIVSFSVPPWVVLPLLSVKAREKSGGKMQTRSAVTIIWTFFEWAPGRLLKLSEKLGVALIVLREERR